jgi:hypothetical protein
MTVCKYDLITGIETSDGGTVEESKIGGVKTVAGNTLY